MICQSPERDTVTASGGAAAAPGPLGNNADFASALPSPADFLPPPSTVTAWYLRSLARDLLKNNGIERRMRWCGSKISPRDRGVEVFRRPDRAYGRVGGVCVCGQSICCPVCAPRIAAFRAAEVATAYERGRDMGCEVRLETFTKPHILDERPGALTREIGEFASLWRGYQSGRRALERERGAVGHHLGREVNWGNNGWHYHHHRLRYDLPSTFSPDLAKVQWLSSLRGAGYDGPGLDTYAYDCGEVGDVAGAKYCAKLATSVQAQARAVGSEVASSATKGRSINSLLADFAAGDEVAASHWVKGVACITRLKVSSVRWSRGLRGRFAVAPEKSDVAIAADEVVATDEFLGALTPGQWRGILKWRAEFALCVAANKGEDAVNEFLSGLDLGELNPSLPEPRFNKYDRAI